MKAGQKLITRDGLQGILFPMEYMAITQGVDGSFTHDDTMNIDIAGNTIYVEMAYAMADCKVVEISADKSGVIFETLNIVDYAHGIVDYFHWRMYHDQNTSDLYIGKTFKQGDKIYDEGKYGNATGNHIHLSCGRGKNQGTIINSKGNRELKAEIEPYKAMFINGTIIKKSLGYDWKEYKPMNLIPAINSTIRTELTDLRMRETPSLTGKTFGYVPAKTDFLYAGYIDADGWRWAKFSVADKFYYAAIKSLTGSKVYMEITVPKTEVYIESAIDTTLTDGVMTVHVTRPEISTLK